jgi:Raf kinase inhibitor-like YbhB/YbcL family protein
MGVTIPVLLEHPLVGIPERYTCNGANISLPVLWSGVPSGTAELALFMVNQVAVHGGLPIYWAVTGLKSMSHGIPAGKLPQGAVVGRNSDGTTGYSICPPKGKNETYIIKVFALPRPLKAQPGFDANTLFLRVEEEATDVGETGAAYRGK